MYNDFELKYIHQIYINSYFLKHKQLKFQNTSWVLWNAICREGVSLALVGHSSSNGVTIKMLYGIDVLH